MKKDGADSALHAAARMLSSRPLSEKELTDKLLSKGYGPDAAAEAVEKLKALSYIDDKAYAETVVRHYKGRGYGPRRLTQELARRGIDKETAETALAEAEAREAKAPETGREDALCALLRAKLKNAGRDDLKARNRAVQAAARRGYTWEQIESALTRITRDITEE